MTAGIEAPPRLSAALEAMSETARAAFMEHLSGGTSADWLAEECKRAGIQLGATTIKNYRRTLRQESVQS